MLGAILGGGFGRLMGLYGLGVDKLISVNLVTSYGTQLTVTPNTWPELWWALRDAGRNFGIVTSAVIKSYPLPAAQNGAWAGSLIFSLDKIEVLVQAIDDLVLASQMVLFLYYAVSDGAPVVLVTISYAGPSNTDGAEHSRPSYCSWTRGTTDRLGPFQHRQRSRRFVLREGWI